MKNPTKFWNKAAPSYAKSKIGNPEAYAYTCGRTQSYLQPDDVVLELGCGTGSTALVFAPHVKRIVATDLSSEMLRIARAKAEADGVENVSFELLDIEQEPPVPGQFRVVMAHSLFHLVPEMERSFAQIFALLPPGGLFISKTACLGEKGQGLMGLAITLGLPIMKMIGKAPYVRSFSTSELRAKIAEVGFEIVEQGNHPAGPPPAHYVVARKPLD